MTDHLDAPSYQPRYAILRNKSAAEVEDFARTHPRVFVFAFATLSIEDCPDYSSLAPPDEPDIMMPEHRHYIVQPMYLGNFDEPEKAIRSVIEQVFGEDHTNNAIEII
jgi:hypothetical protein